MAKLLLLILLGVPCSAAWAATRCEDPAGKVSYVEGTCPAGTQAVREVSAPVPAPTKVEQSAALQRSREEQKQAEKLRKEREVQEKSAALQQARAADAAAKKQRKCDLLGVRLKRAEEDVRTSDQRTLAMKQKHAKRRAEDYAMECGKK
jgi:hypothetical protein